MAIGMIAALTVFAAVAYAFAGGLARVVVESTPPGAKVIVGNQVVGTTPATLDLGDTDKIRVKVKKKGYKTRTVTIKPVEGKTRRVKVKLKKAE